MTKPAMSADTYVKLTVNQVRRGALVHVPSTYTAKQRHPLLVALHPSNGSSSGMEQITNFDPLSDRSGFVVVYPDSVGPRWDNQGTSDTSFIRALIVMLGTKWSLDPRRIYAAGYSDGGGFAQQLVCTAAGEYAGLATVGTSMGNIEESACHPSVPVTYLAFRGTADPFVPIDGGPNRGPYTQGEPTNSSSQVLQFWASVDGCSPVQTSSVSQDRLENAGATSDLEYTYSSCRNATTASLFVINGGGHTWPGGTQTPTTSLGDVSQGLKTSALIISTLGGHQSSAANVCLEGASVSCSVAHGKGATTCVGGQPAACQITSCNTGFIAQGGVCAPQ